MIILALQGGVEMEKEKLKIAVLAMCEKDVEKHPGEVGDFIKKSYSDHPDDWKPFLGQSIEDLSIDDLICEVEEEFDIHFISISGDLINEGLEKLIKEDLKKPDERLLKKQLAYLSEEFILFIIDCFSLEIGWIRLIAGEIDYFSKIGCLMPMNEKYPEDIREKMRKLREKHLDFINTKFTQTEIVEEASTITVFKKNLKRIATNLVRKKIRENARKDAPAARVDDASAIIVKQGDITTITFGSNPQLQRIPQGGS